MASDSPSSIPREEADFVVVGAGFAGLTAALRLSEHGSVIVLEARDYPGGRVKTGNLDDGTWLDFGGTWFGPGQDHAYALAAEMGIGTYPTYNEGNFVLVLADGTIVRKPEGFPLSELLPAALSALVLAEFEEMHQQLPTDAPWTAPKAREWDKQSFAAWVDSRLGESLAGELTALNTLMEGFFTSDTAEVSLLDALYLIQSHQGLLHITGVKGGDQQDRVMGGAQAIAKEIQRQLGSAVRLCSPVRQITQDDNGVEVVADTVVVRAKRAIVAMPPPVSGRIRYQPPLPAARAMLVERAPSGEIIKVLVAYETPFWRAEGYSGQSMAVSDPVGATYDGCTDTAEVGLLIAFVFGRHARDLARLGKDERRGRILESLAKRFGPQAATPIKNGYFEHEWTTDPWSGGGMIAHFPPGVLTNFGPALREPFGFIHWAGSESSSAFHCSINAAIESGERAAADVVASLPAGPA